MVTSPLNHAKSSQFLGYTVCRLLVWYSADIYIYIYTIHVAGLLSLFEDLDFAFYRARSKEYWSSYVRWFLRVRPCPGTAWNPNGQLVDKKLCRGTLLADLLHDTGAVVRITWWCHSLMSTVRTYISIYIYDKPYIWRTYIYIYIQYR